MEWGRKSHLRFSENAGAILQNGTCDFPEWQVRFSVGTPDFSHSYTQSRSQMRPKPYIKICVYPLAMAQRSESKVKFHLNSAKSASHLKAKFYNGRLKPSLTHWLSLCHIPANLTITPWQGNHTFHNFQLSIFNPPVRGLPRGGDVHHCTRRVL